MLKAKKRVVYSFDGISPITREQLSEYREMSQFFVSRDGKVLYISPDLPQECIERLTGGEFMYKDQLETLVFAD